MTRTAYTLMLRLLAPFLWLWMAVRARKTGREWEIFSRSRFGLVDASAQQTAYRGCVWIHAVSLGETRAAQPLIQELLKAGERLLLTHTTPTGRSEGARLFAAAIASGQLGQTWLPYDFPGATRRFMQRYRPRIGILVEREVWPNLLEQARLAGVPMALVSARLSVSSLRQARWLGRALKQAYGSIRLILAQTVDDAARLVEMGARDVRVVGNMKFDLALPADQLDAGRAWRSALGRPVIAIASTREGEDAPFADLILTSSSDAAVPPFYLLIPRHPQRFDTVAALLADHKLPYERRSSMAASPGRQTRVMLGDTLGEMAFYYAAADVAIIGGGFAPLGGQNLIEACAAGAAVIVGPHMHNFEQATRDAVAAGAAVEVADAAEAMRLASVLLSDDRRRINMRNAALTFTAGHAGATGRIMHALAPWLED
ncbi:3-deoxy-D-manno-octulosonic acid transferase [Achromobacter aloeverae]